MKAALAFSIISAFPFIEKEKYNSEAVEAPSLPWCANNSHITGRWARHEQSIQKGYVCCGGGYAGPYGQGPPYDFEKAPGYCYPQNTLPTFFEHGYAEYGAQCGDDCCRCDRDDGTRFSPNVRETFYWKPKNCRLHDWDAKLFCQLLGNRTVLLMGDSSMQQTSSTLMSMITAGNGTCAPNVFFARSDHVVFGFKGHNFYSSIVDKHEPDISVISAGPHIDDTGDVNHIITQVDHHHKVRQKQNKKVPVAIWKTQNPGHPGCQKTTLPIDFGSDVEITTELIKQSILNTTCIGRDKYGWCSFIEFDRFVKIRCPQVGFRILDMTPLYLRKDAHVIGKKDDCLHYCQPGPINLFSILFLQMLSNGEV